MEQTKVSTLIKKLQIHLDKYGDSPVMIYDEYSCLYKSFTDNHISRMPGNRFVIDCEREED